MKTSDAQECVTKICTKCGETKELDEYRQRKLKSGNATYRIGECKDCERARGRKYRNEHIDKCRASVSEWKKNNPEKNAAHARKAHAKRMQKGRCYSAEYERTKELAKTKQPSHEPKICKKCCETKPANEFIFQKVFGSRHAWCNSCRSAYAKNYWKTKKDDYGHREKRRIYYITRGKFVHQKWVENNRLNVREINRAQYKKHKAKRIESAKVWAINNRERINSNNKKRRSDLTDSVVKGIISSQTRLNSSEISTEIVTLKRSRIMIHRAIKKQKQIIKELSNAK